MEQPQTVYLSIGLEQASTGDTCDGLHAPPHECSDVGTKAEEVEKLP